MSGRILFSLLTLLAFGALVRGEVESKPAADSPKAALMAQDAAAKSGNVDADMEFYKADGEPQKKLARAIAASDVAVAKLEKAVSSRFGDELATAAVRAAGTESSDDIAAATEEVDGDRATVKFANTSTPVPMIRVEGKWKVSLGHWTKGASDDELDQLAAKLSELATQINQITELVSQDKFRSGEGVRDRIQELRGRLLGPG